MVVIATLMINLNVEINVSLSYNINDHNEFLWYHKYLLSHFLKNLVHYYTLIFNEAYEK